MSQLYKLGISKRRRAFLRRPGAYLRAWKRELPGRPPLVVASARRQARTAQEILRRLEAQKGVLLADDVGLGKTAIAVLVSAAFLTYGKTVRILAPNDMMARRWREGLDLQFRVLARMLGGDAAERLQTARRRLHGLRRLRQGNVQVTTHGRLRATTIDCDLLIIDEAHRSRGDGSAFGRLLEKSAHRYGRILLLTATPFSLNVGELGRALRLVGTEKTTIAAARRFGATLEKLWSGDFGRPDAFGALLGKNGAAAIRQLRQWVIRHSMDDQALVPERAQFGSWEPWAVEVERADEKSLETIIRADQLLSVAKLTGAWSQHRTNDPRFHQGNEHLRQELERLPKGKEPSPGSTHRAAQELHRAWLLKTLAEGKPHAKITAAVRALREVSSQGEKVLVFCDHLAPARELARTLAAQPVPPGGRISLGALAWYRAWQAVLGELDIESLESVASPRKRWKAKTRLQNLAKWLSCRAVRVQVMAWLPARPKSEVHLVQLLRKSAPRRRAGAGTIAGAARALFLSMNSRESGSTRAKLEEGASALPGWGSHRRLVMSTVDEGSVERPQTGVFFPNEPDTLMAIFNSPFGPDVLVTTDRLSEGVDLHGSCRHIMQYELDPSPIRTVQRRGRLRRIGSWAAKTHMPLREAFPAFLGTRDQALVGIMRRRLQQFGLLLGGVGETIEVDADFALETVRKQETALEVAKEKLEGMGLALS